VLFIIKAKKDGRTVKKSVEVTLKAAEVPSLSIQMPMQSAAKNLND